MQRTFHTRIRTSTEEATALQNFASHFSKIKHSLLGKILGADGDKDTLNALKRKSCEKWGITSRQYNAIRVEVLGLISGTRELQKTQANDLKAKIAVLSVPPDERKNRQKYKETPKQKHYRIRKLHTTEQKLKNLKIDMAAGKIHVTFGSKKLFEARQHLIKSGYVKKDGAEDIERWDAEWLEARENQFSVIGANAETGGCAGCIATIQEDGNIQLRLRLPNGGTQKYLVLQNVNFNTGHKKIIEALKAGIALFYRFIKDKKGWKTHISLNLPEVPQISVQHSGRISVDQNADHLAVSELNRHGNAIHRFNIPLIIFGKSTEQAQAIVGDAVKILVQYAIKVGKPIAVEKLDFQRKKATLRFESARYARMLSSLAYSLILSTIKARAFDAGIEVFEVNPAFTSVMGEVLYQRRLGMSRHQSASVVIGRRSMKFRDRAPVSFRVPPIVTCTDLMGHVREIWPGIVKRRAALNRASVLGKITLKAPSRKGGLPVVELGSVLDTEQAGEMANRVQNCSGHVRPLENGCAQ